MNTLIKISNLLSRVEEGVHFLLIMILLMALLDALGCFNNAIHSCFNKSDLIE